MGDLKFLQSYSGESVEQLLALATTHRVDSLVLVFEQAVEQKAAQTGYQLSHVEHAILAVGALEREVNNGGYSQFFLNSSNAFVPATANTLDEIGCPKTAEITRKAIGALSVGGTLTPFNVETAMNEVNDARDARLDQCDQAYYRSGENIAASLFAYIAKNRSGLRLG
jgi:hypothetical protein